MKRGLALACAPLVVAPVCGWLRWLRLAVFRTEQGAWTRPIHGVKLRNPYLITDLQVQSAAYPRLGVAMWLMLLALLVGEAGAACADGQLCIECNAQHAPCWRIGQQQQQCCARDALLLCTHLCMPQPTPAPAPIPTPIPGPAPTLGPVPTPAPTAAAGMRFFTAALGGAALGMVALACLHQRSRSRGTRNPERGQKQAPCGCLWAYLRPRGD